jgi:hypothetical protein
MGIYTHLLDFHFGTMSAPLYSRIDINGRSVNVEYQAVGESVTINILPDAVHNAPGTEQATRQFFEGIGATTDASAHRFTLALPNPDSYRPALLGWLRSAYVLAFAGLGYKYILHNSMDIVRHQLMNIDDVVIRSFSITVTEGPSDTSQLFISTQPSWLGECIVVKMKKELVFLPWFDSNPSLYKKLETNMENGEVFLDTFSGKEIPWPHGPAHLLDDNIGRK